MIVEIFAVCQYQNYEKYSSRLGRDPLVVSFDQRQLFPLLLSPNLKYLESIPREGRAADDLLHHLFSPKICYLHCPFLLEFCRFGTFDFLEGSCIAMASWFIVPDIELEEGGSPGI